MVLNLCVATYAATSIFVGGEGVRPGRWRSGGHKNHQEQEAVLEPGPNRSSFVGAYESARCGMQILYRLVASLYTNEVVTTLRHIFKIIQEVFDFGVFYVKMVWEWGNIFCELLFSGVYKLQ